LTFDIRFKTDKIEPFEKGKVVEARTARGEDLLKKLLDTDEGVKCAGR
jgi:aminopeptidase